MQKRCFKPWIVATRSVLKADPKLQAERKVQERPKRGKKFCSCLLSLLFFFAVHAGGATRGANLLVPRDLL